MKINPILLVKNRYGCYHSFSGNIKVDGKEILMGQSPIDNHEYIRALASSGGLNGIKKLVYGYHDDNVEKINSKGHKVIRSCDVGLIISYPTKFTFKVLSNPHDPDSKALFEGSIFKNRHYITDIL